MCMGETLPRPQLPFEGVMPINLIITTFQRLISRPTEYASYRLGVLKHQFIVVIFPSKPIWTEHKTITFVYFFFDSLAPEINLREWVTLTQNSELQCLPTVKNKKIKGRDD